MSPLDLQSALASVAVIVVLWGAAATGLAAFIFALPIWNAADLAAKPLGCNICMAGWGVIAIGAAGLLVADHPAPLCFAVVAFVAVLPRFPRGPLVAMLRLLALVATGYSAVASLRAEAAWLRDGGASVSDLAVTLGALTALLAAWAVAAGALRGALPPVSPDFNDDVALLMPPEPPAPGQIHVPSRFGYG